MTEVEQFLANQKLFRCEALSANMTPQQCQANRDRKANFVNDVFDVGPCKVCQSPITGKEESVANNRCSVEGCDKWQVIEGMCTKHAHAHGKTKPVRTEEEKKAMQAEKLKKMQAALKAKREAGLIVPKAKKQKQVKAKLPAMTRFAVDAGLVKEDVVREAISHPAHYGGADNPYEAIKVIEAWELNFHLGNVVKYVSRAGKKGSELEDLQKAQWYLQREIEKRTAA